MKRAVLLALTICLAASVGRSEDRKSAAVESVIADAPTGDSISPLPNFMHVSERLFCGGEPDGSSAFAFLAGRGIRTILSVDGTTPNVESARRFGIRYVHIPIGYDGVGEAAGLSLARLARDSDAPIYVHCHHGCHRAPVAAALISIAAGEVDSRGALGILKRAGTSKHYRGLWRAVENFQAPPSNAELPLLVEIAEVPSLAFAMSTIDRCYDNLRMCRDHDWEPLGSNRSVIAHHEALQLKERLREACRNLSSDFDSEFRGQLSHAESVAQNLEDALAASDRRVADEQFHLLGQSCTRCHNRYRN